MGGSDLNEWTDLDLIQLTSDHGGVNNDGKSGCLLHGCDMHFHINESGCASALQRAKNSALAIFQSLQPTYSFACYLSTIISMIV